MGLWTQTTIPPKPYDFSTRVDSSEMCTLGFQLPTAPQNDYQLHSLICLPHSYTLFYNLPTESSIPLLQTHFCFFSYSYTLFVYHLSSSSRGFLTSVTSFPQITLSIQHSHTCLKFLVCLRLQMFPTVVYHEPAASTSATLTASTSITIKAASLSPMPSISK